MNFFVHSRPTAVEFDYGNSRRTVSTRSVTLRRDRRSDQGSGLDIPAVRHRHKSLDR